MPGIVGLAFSLVIVRVGSGVSPNATSGGPKSGLQFANFRTTPNTTIMTSQFGQGIASGRHSGSRYYEPESTTTDQTHSVRGGRGGSSSGVTSGHELEDGGVGGGISVHFGDLVYDGSVGDGSMTNRTENSSEREHDDKDRDPTSKSEV
ncbi:hypothetical protein K435DRAFT_836803 [Dendrothele bispora CBS 962.96]|nr:hypothetical protein K435DRAFT_836803 [Dendrothele bispora CBS 962.96]